ncbi:hypothetical protein [Flavobacterium sp.]|uniref:hypothetical protein n=1 Tax=Flavobacterium sp. TaxID=239 RepID=UPI003784F9C4
MLIVSEKTVSTVTDLKTWDLTVKGNNNKKMVTDKIDFVIAIHGFRTNIQILA